MQDRVKQSLSDKALGYGAAKTLPNEEPFAVACNGFVYTNVLLDAATDPAPADAIFKLASFLHEPGVPAAAAGWGA